MGVGGGRWLQMVTEGGGYLSFGQVRTFTGDSG